ncbi:MAG: hypothetical protein KDA85_16630, partial [Planctomycetaceae bacterium]|nr:hypothetical protein [Planctomycetaceae bacterium]
MATQETNEGLMRRDFVRLSAGIVGALGIPGLTDQRSSTAVSALRPRFTLDETWLVVGLTGMARSKGWFNAHLGAAVLAGYYLCRENSFSEALVVAIQQQLESLVRVHEAQFAEFEPQEADQYLVERIPAALRPALEGGLRAHGHAAIYTALAVRALRDAPQMAQPQIIRLLCEHNAQIAQKAPERPTQVTEYADTQALVEALFTNLARFEPLLGRPSVRRPNFVHMTTHTEALLTLDELGYHELVRIGHAGHQAHVSAPVPEFDPV